MPWADPQLMNSQLGPALQQAGFGSTNPQGNPYWFNQPSLLQPGQGNWSSAPGLLSKGFPDAWYDPSSLGRTTTDSSMPTDSGAAASAAAGPKWGGYGGGSPGSSTSPILSPGAGAQSGGFFPGGGGYGSPIGAQNNAFTSMGAAKAGNIPTYSGGIAGTGSPMGAWGLGGSQAGQLDQSTAGSYQIPAAAVRGGAPGSAYAPNVANQYLYNLNQQANNGSAPNMQQALLSAGNTYGLNFQPLANGAGWKAQLPQGTTWW